VASAVASIAFIGLGVYASIHPIRQQRQLSDKTTACFRVGDGLLRIGWYTGSVPLRVVGESGPDATQPTFILYPDDPTREVPVTFTGKSSPISLLRYHALTWQRPIFRSQSGLVMYSGLRFWIGTPAVLLALWPAISFVRGPLRRFRRRRRGLCIPCGYNLAGNASGVCPECGTKFESLTLTRDSTRFNPPNGTTVYSPGGRSCSPLEGA